MPMPLKIIFLFLFVLLSGCGSTPVNQASSPIPNTNPIPKDQTIDGLLSQANQAVDPTEKVKNLLQACDLMQRQGQYERCDTVIKMIDFDNLSTALKEQYILLALENASQSKNTDRMKEILLKTKDSYFQQVPPDIQKQALILISDAYEQTNQYLKAAITRINASALFTEDNYRDNINKIWQLLSKSNSVDISNALPDYTAPDIQGWLQLALSIKQNQLSLDQQVIALYQWQKKWPQHPAAIQLPDELKLLSELPERRPSKIAIALPLTGPLSSAGKSVLDGFLAAFYADKFHKSHNTSIQIFDTHAQNAPDLLNALNQANPDLIIGPLQKSILIALATSQETHINAPMLALNYLEGNIPNVNDDIYQFGLAPEDEVNQITNKLWENGIRKIAAIMPDSDWGTRIYSQLKKDWDQKNGIIVNSTFYDSTSTINKNIAELLSITDSKSRALHLKRILPVKINFEPRRRQDIQSIFLVANPQDARQIKPLLSFYYASDIPVDAISSIYSGTLSPEKDSDLNGITFTSTPWLLSNTNSIKSALQEEQPHLSKRYGNLMALGADAYRLAPRLELLSKFKNSRVQGENGILQLDDNHVIHRKLDWAKFDNGKPQVID
jgi:outer membrane PBP1 activator LpoA protein